MITRWYRPIEIVLGLPYNQNVDVFSTGALLLELYLGTEIFRSSSNIDQFYWIVKICGFPQNWKAGQEALSKLGLNIENSSKKPVSSPQLKQLMSRMRPLARDLISKMLTTHPNDRIEV